MRALVLVAVLAAAASAQAPNITVTAGDLSATLDVGETTSRAILIGNDGTAPLTYRVRTSSGEGTAVVYASSVNDTGINTVYAIDPSTGAVRSSFTVPFMVSRLAFDGGTLYALDGLTVRSLNPATGETLRSVTLSPSNTSWYYEVADVAVADGRLAVVAYTGTGSKLDVFDLATGASVRTVQLDLTARTVAAGDGVYYVSGDDAAAGQVLVTINAATGARLRTLSFPSVGGLTYSRALGVLLTRPDDVYSSTVRVYDAATGNFLSSFDLPRTGTYYYSSRYGGLAADEGTEAPWLSVAPRTGTVGSGGQAGLTLTIDAGRVLGGTYSANVVVSSNDPDEPVVELPVTLVAVGVPKVSVTPQAVAFGTAYVGTPVTRRLTVRNPGSDTLRVSAVTVSDARVTFSESAFELPPADSLVLALTLTPTGSGPLDATLTLATNVEDRASVTVALTATDVFPPVLAVTPGSLVVDGNAGEVATATLTVSNTGQGPLSYAVAAGLTGTTVPERGRASRRASLSSESDVTARTARSAEALTLQRESRAGSAAVGVDAPRLTVLVTDEDDNPVVDLVALRGAIQNDSLYLALDYAAIPDEISFEVILDLDTDPNTGYFYEAIGAEAYVSGYAYYDQYGGAGYFGQVDAYSFDGSSGSYNGNTFEVSGNTLTVAVPLASVPGLGRAFDLTVSTFGAFTRDGMGFRSGDDRAPNDGIVAVNSAPWLSVSPEAGEVAAGASADLTLTLDATALLGGTYQGEVVVEGNGPEPQVVTVPVTFEVTGVPVASAAPLAFGSVFVGYPSAQTLVLTNTGTDDLTVTSVESDNAALSATGAAGSVLRPGASLSIPVSVTAAEPGAIRASLSVVTTAPGSPLVVAVTATASRPPVTAVSARSLTVEVSPGETTEATVTLENTGASPLTYRTRLVATSAEAQSRTASEPAAEGQVLAAVGPALRLAREAALSRTGVATLAAARVTSAANLPTLLIDPDEGLLNDVVEVRGQTNGSQVDFEIVFARAPNFDDFNAALYLDTDRNSSTGYAEYVGGVLRNLGVDVGVYLFDVRFGRIYVSQNVPPYDNRYLDAVVDGRSIRFSIPTSFAGSGAFDFVGLARGGGRDDAFPDTGVASVDARLGWLALTPEAGTVAAGEAVTVRLQIDASSLELGTRTALVQIATNDPGEPVVQIPLTVTVRVNTPVEEPVAPATFALGPPSPNPTRGPVRLAYTLAEGAPVSVEVYDALGRQVAALDQGTRSAGAYVAELGTDGLPAGVYSVRLRAGASVAVQRLSVVR